MKWWDYNPQSRPFIVNFLYVISFTIGNRLNLERLMELGIISVAPRGFEPLSDEAFRTLMENSHGNMRLIID